MAVSAPRSLSRPSTKLSTDDAVLYLRGDRRFDQLVADAYLGPDLGESASRFARSAEFEEVRLLLGRRMRGAILDVGAGTGIATYAFAEAGASLVYALEPSPSDLVGRGAIAALREILQTPSVGVLDGYAESIPLADESVDVVYARQVLHHMADLRRALGECARVLKPGGLLLACREHVVADRQDLRKFLIAHPMEALAGGENAFQLSEYLDALSEAGLRLCKVLGPCDSLINAFPAARNEFELQQLPLSTLRARYGLVCGLLRYVPGLLGLVRKRLNRPARGHLYSFVARKEQAQK